MNKYELALVVNAVIEDEARAAVLNNVKVGTKSTHSRMHISLLSLMRWPSLTMRV